MHRSALMFVVVALIGCSDNGGAHPQTSAAVPPTAATAPPFERAEPAAAKQTEPPPVASAEPAPEQEPAKEAAVPDVDVANIGMHIGGEKNTPEEKRPIREAVQKNYDDLRRCWDKSEKPREATFGVDMRIKGEGGLAKITNPRSGFKTKTVTHCMTGVFEQVSFPKNAKGVDQMVSYSVRFRKK